MPKSKSAKFREMYNEGYSIAQIARVTGDYYSFVHRVIRRHELELSKKGEEQHDEPEGTEATGS